METSLYSVDLACASNHLVCHRYSSRVPQVARAPWIAQPWHWLPTPPEHTTLDGDTTYISCTNVTQT